MRFSHYHLGVTHADAVTLSKLAAFLKDLRQRTILREKSPGIFYLKSSAFLHFHDDPAGIFADVKLDSANYSRHRVSTRSEQRALLKRIDQSLGLAQLPHFSEPNAVFSIV